MSFLEVSWERSSSFPGEFKLLNEGAPDKFKLKGSRGYQNRSLPGDQGLFKYIHQKVFRNSFLQKHLTSHSDYSIHIFFVCAGQICVGNPVSIKFMLVYGNFNLFLKWQFSPKENSFFFTDEDKKGKVKQFFHK